MLGVLRPSGHYAPQKSAPSLSRAHPNEPESLSPRQPTAAPRRSSPGTGPLVLVTLQTLPKQAPLLSPSPSPHVRLRFPKGTADLSCERPGHSDPTTHLATRGRLPGLSSEAHSVQHAGRTDRRGCPSRRQPGAGRALGISVKYAPLI